MRGIPLALGVLLLVLPTARAEPVGVDVDKETDTLTQRPAEIGIQERLDFRVVDASVYASSATWELLVQTGARSLLVSVERGGIRESVGVERISSGPSGRSSHDAVKINLTGLHSGLLKDDRLALIVNYSVPLVYDHALTSDVPSLVVYAEPFEGFVPAAMNLPPFLPAGDRLHSAMASVPSGFVFRAEFQEARAPAHEARDLNSYVWGAGGLVLGFSVALVAVRKGWLTGARATKFEKGGAMESRDLLDARRRTLMAALKELEVAHEGKEIPDAAYAPLKEEYKAQAVRVIRNLDEKKEPPGG